MLRAIETEYKGYRFRSRLEARWAVFFDACGVKWEYEPEGFVLQNGQQYLPDFLLHLQDYGPVCHAHHFALAMDEHHGEGKGKAYKRDGLGVHCFLLVSRLSRNCWQSFSI